MKHTQLSLLSLALISVFSSAAYADDEPIAGRIPLSLDNHAQQAAEEVRKINAQQFSGNLNGQEIATPALQDRNDGAFSGSLNMPIDLQVKGYQPEINQSYDLQSNSNYVLPVSNTANAVNWQIDDSYALETGNYLNNVFQQDTDTLLLAENTVTETKTDATPAREVLSGSLNESSTNSKEITTTATQSENDDNHQDSSPAIQNDGDTENTQTQDNVAPVAVTASTGGATQLDDITVKASRTVKPAQRYQSTISRRQIEMKSQGNGDIGSMLRGMSNVQFDNSYGSSNTPGEIDPAKFSISGGQFYQNLITVDGLNIASKMDPANSSGSWLSAPPGHTQTMNVDVDLLDKITVMKSGISAEYGGFSGGVVETEYRRPEVPLGFKISRKYTNGNYGRSFPKSLTKYHIYGDAEEEAKFINSYDKSKQPEFKKYVTQITPESIINDKWGVIGSFNLTESIIPLRMHDDTYDDKDWASPIDPPDSATAKKNQKRSNLNAMIKAYYDPTENLGLELSYTYAPNYSREYIVGTQGFDYYENEGGGHTLNFKTKWNNDWGKLTNTFGVQQSTDKVTSSGYDSIRYWSTSKSKYWSNWASWTREGGNAPTEQNVLTFTEKLKQEFKPFKWGNTEHAIKVGGELQYNKADFKYAHDFYAGIKSSRAMTREQQERCKQTDMYWCDPALVYDPRKFDEFNGDSVQKETWLNRLTGETMDIQVWPYGQYFKSIGFYRGGEKIKATDKSAALFIEDEITIPLGEKRKYGELSVRPGVRYEYNGLMKQHNIAPRFFSDYAFPWSGEDRKFSTHISAGYNRYYGNNFYSYALNDGKERMNIDIYRDDPLTSWDSLLAENRECVPYESERVQQADGTWKWEYWHYKNGQRVEGRDTNCVQHYASSTKFDQLKMPYSDEFMVGLSQDLGPITAALQYVRRNGRDEVISAYSDEYGPDGVKRGKLDGYRDTWYRYYTNGGKSKTNIVTLDIKNTRPLVWKGIRNNFTLAFDWTQTERNKENYNQYYRNSDYEQPFILYEGTLMHRSQKPQENFTKPYTVKLEANHEWDMLGGKWRLNNLLNFQAGYKSSVTNSKWDRPGREFGLPQDKVSEYRITRIPSSFTWDMKLGAEYDIYKKNKLFFNVDISNVTNKRNITTVTVNSNTNTVTENYATGRAFWFELGYKYH